MMETTNSQNQIFPPTNSETKAAESALDFKTLLGGVLFLLFFALVFRNGIPQEPVTTAPPFIKKAAVEEPVLTARAYLAARLKNGEVLLEKEKDTPLSVASITKLWTADIFFSHFQDPLELVLFSDDALRKKFFDEKMSGVFAGERIKAEDVLWFMLVDSANDAARAAAETTALRVFPDLQSASFEEKIAAFVRLMNERAAALGLINTHFANPEGLDDSAHYSSASDIFLFIQTLARERPNFFPLMRRIASGIAGESGRVYRFDNTNRILAKYPKIIASKTGSTKDAKETLVLAYELFSNDPVVIVLLGSDNRDADVDAMIRWLEAAFIKPEETIQ
jgi:serine-type D-Ala-D-Ala carboxypeptidase (penicillin-binding protein 5/6)